MDKPFVNMLAEILSETTAAEHRYGNSISYLGNVIGDAPGLVQRLSESWHDLKTDARHLHQLRSAPAGKQPDLIGQRIAIEHLLMAASRAGPIINAALADQYVNIIEEPEALTGSSKSFHDGQQWLERAIKELEDLDDRASTSVSPVSRWQLLLRAALLCHVIVGECLNLLAENIAADLSTG